MDRISPSLESRSRSDCEPLQGVFTTGHDPLYRTDPPISIPWAFGNPFGTLSCLYGPTAISVLRYGLGVWSFQWVRTRKLFKSARSVRGFHWSRLVHRLHRPRHNVLFPPCFPPRPPRLYGRCLSCPRLVREGFDLQSHRQWIGELEGYHDCHQHRR